MVEDTCNSEAVLPQLHGAGFGIRLLARLIDLFVTTLVGWFMLIVVTIFISAIAYASGDTQQVFVQHFVLEQSETEWLMGLFAIVAYHAVAEHLSGSTMGKWMTGLTVIREDGSAPVGFRQGIGRNLAVGIDAICIGLPAVQSMYKTPQRQRHGDVWNRTMVIRRRDLPANRRANAGAFLVGLCAALTAFAILSILGNLARIL
jgi:uncharacterized RDD family membrane protein YckC